jgi:ubiquinone/menaquinone biosynthesis C-methylase UbiE
MKTEHYLKERTAKEYDKERFETNKWQKEYMDLLERGFVAKYSKGCVLDVGCGTGRMSFLSLYQGLDFSDEMIKKAQEQHPERIFFKADVFKIPFEDETFDTVIAFRLFMHLKNKWRKAFDEIYRVTKTGGRIICDIKMPLCNVLKKEKIKTISLSEFNNVKIILDYPPIMPMTKFILIEK